MPRRALLRQHILPATHAAPTLRGLRGRRVGATAALALVGVMLATSPAAASWIQTKTSAEGKVTRVRDGDTVDVDVWGDGTSTPQTIRNTGIQAMETGQCHAAQATKLMTSLAAAKTVRLTARYAGTSSLGRPVRYVDAEKGSVFTDTQLPLLNAGLALALTLGNETSRWRTYMYAQQKAERTGANLWDTDYCRSGPQPRAPDQGVGQLRRRRRRDPEPQHRVGADPQPGQRHPVADRLVAARAAQDYFRFPTGTWSSRLHPDRVRRQGDRTATKLLLGQLRAQFPNSDEPGALRQRRLPLRPQGDLRSHTSFPCLVHCTDSRAGQVAMEVNYDAPGDDQTNPNGEWVALEQPGHEPVDLSYTTLWATATPVSSARQVLKPASA